MEDRNVASVSVCEAVSGGTSRRSVAATQELHGSSPTVCCSSLVKMTNGTKPLPKCESGGIKVDHLSNLSRVYEAHHRPTTMDLLMNGSRKKRWLSGENGTNGTKEKTGNMDGNGLGGCLDVGDGLSAGVVGKCLVALESCSDSDHDGSRNFDAQREKHSHGGIR